MTIPLVVYLTRQRLPEDSRAAWGLMFDKMILTNLITGLEPRLARNIRAYNPADIQAARNLVEILQEMPHYQL